MSGFTVDQPAQILAAAPGVSIVGANTRVKGQGGFLSTAMDVLNFSNGGVGQWTVPNTKTRILGAFMVSQSSQGIATIPGPASAPVQCVTGDPKIRSL